MPKDNQPNRNMGRQNIGNGGKVDLNHDKMQPRRDQQDCQMPPDQQNDRQQQQQQDQDRDDS
jgi:hypothetical protein